jgi:hypothetical protein
MRAERTQLITCCILHVLEYHITFHETNKSKRLVVVGQHGQESAQLYLPNCNFMLQCLPLNSDAYSVGIIKPQFIVMFANQGPCLKTLATNLYLHAVTS